jgi:hypothetical protein
MGAVNIKFTSDSLKKLLPLSIPFLTPYHTTIKIPVVAIAPYVSTFPFTELLTGIINDETMIKIKKINISK